MNLIFDKLFNNQTLTVSEAQTAMENIANGLVNPSQIASFITVFLVRPISVDEIIGFRSVLLNKCIKVDLNDFDPMDVCGTGGDGKHTFNISTLACFIAAGAGVKIAKHGNYAVSSVSGSSNVLEYLGLTFSNDESKLKSQIDKSGVCILHAPMFHPAMKNVAPIRKELGIKTFFNILGPMINPAKPKKQLTGVYNLELARLYSNVFQKVMPKYTIVHSLDGYDEVSLTGNFKIFTELEESVYSPKQLNFTQTTEIELYGGNSVKDAADIFTRILNLEGTRAQNEVAIANAALAIHCYTNNDLLTSIELAKESLYSGKAKNSLKLLLSN